MAIEIDADNEDIQRIAPVLTSLREACHNLGVDFFVIGALARDLHLQHLNDIDAPRRTRDVDVAVALDGWQSYADLRDRLITDHEFTNESPKQRVRSPEGIQVDLVPFGGIADSSGQIRFPPDDRPEMTVLGLEEARQTTVSVTLGDGVQFEVVSLPALGLLKLIAWDERPRQRVHDAQDLCFILRWYYSVKIDTIVEKHYDLIDVDDFSEALTSAQAFGRELSSLLVGSDALREYTIDILDRETNDFHQSDLTDAMNAAGCYYEYDMRFESVEALRTGVREGSEE